MKEFINRISVNGVVAVSLCFGMIDLAQSLSSGLLGFLSRSVIKEK